MRRNENFEATRLCDLEDALHAPNGVVFLKAFADKWPGKPSFTKHLILRINEHNRGVTPVDLHRVSFGSPHNWGFGLDLNDMRASHSALELVPVENCLTMSPLERGGQRSCDPLKDGKSAFTSQFGRRPRNS